MRHDQSANYLASLKSEFGESLGYDLGILLFEWWEAKRLYRLYQDLFGTDAHRSLMGSAWDGLAGDLQTFIHDSFVLIICRLTDKKKPNKRGLESLTLESLEQHATDMQKPLFQSLFSSARTSSEFARKWRDKEIAHNDRLHFATSSGLSVLSRAEVLSALDAIGECLRFFDPMIFDEPVNLGYDSDLSRYMRILKYGVEAVRDDADSV